MPLIAGAWLEPGPWDCLGALIFATVGALLGCWTILGHLRHYERPSLQRNIVRILAITPLYAVFSFLSLVFSQHWVLFDGVRDIWEAVVIYCFLALIVEYGGGEANCAEVMQTDPGTLRHVFPISVCAKLRWLGISPIVHLNPTFVKWCRRATVQFVVVKPVMAFLAIWMYVSRYNLWSTWTAFEFIVYNVSYSVALYALVLFYLATRSNPLVQSVRPLPKFLAVKIIVFATYWQSLIILALSPQMPQGPVRRWNSFVLCIETPIAAILQLYAFPPREFSPEAPNWRSLLGLQGVEWDAKTARSDDLECGPQNVGMPPSEKCSSPPPLRQGPAREVFGNVKDVLGVADVMEDALYSFKARYAKHSQLNMTSDDDRDAEQNM